jgi:tripartite-type tricarboxylate transporter receptor subunit TctC
LRVSVVVENRPGAGGLIGTEIAARAPADGYTILFGATPTHVLAPLLVRANFDPMRDFTAVFNAAYTTSVLVVNDRIPASTVAELVAYARARPGVLNYASSGVGSANHIDTEVFMDVAGVELVHIPYRGTADGYRALAADEVQLMFGAVTSALPAITAGKARPLAVLTSMRSPMLPQVPTLAEAGLRDVDVRKWQGFLVPAGTPAEIVALLNAAFEKIVREPAVRDWIERQGYEVAGGSAERFAQFLVRDEQKWRAIIDRLGLLAK